MKWFINRMEGSAAYNYLRRETRPESISLSWWLLYKLQHGFIF